uniref:NADH dehydrogenase subunit 5 n=1 Tax=Nototeredo knoxi TaxID=2939324 RepID=UPI0020291F9E|nr:NADH dehydrogenase subunit 5 [Nototeredo knoxi]UPX89279.1 NADH dehydrogenase subunit 5 [Nototeredo knoxi]
MFFMFSLIYYLFYGFVSSGGTMAFEVDLSYSGGFPLSLLFYVDWASVMFSLSVLFISGSIFMYCCFYMRGETYPERFCWLVILFVVFMNLFVFMPSVLGMMLGWDGLGVVSFALVSYYKNRESLAAGNITVLTGRIGDACLVILIACSMSNMSWHWFDMQFLLGFWVMTCVVVASMTKSAQVPFSAWLPAAMAAPTPVSALVHSSTLVTAGVYVLYRYFSCVQGSWLVYLIFISMMTMALSGVVASMEMDLKKVVAFSTMSQLGVMVLGISAAGFKEVGMFHLLVHAYYKSLMFLCVGCVIYKGGGLQDSRFFSGLWFKFPSVACWLAVAAASLSALPFTSGFFSKHAVVEGCLYSEMSMLGSFIICLSVFFTAFYSARLISMIFCKRPSDRTYTAFPVALPMHQRLTCLYLTISLYLLGTASLMAGWGLMKCFVFLNGYVYAPTYMKITSLSMTVLGTVFGLWKNSPSLSFFLWEGSLNAGSLSKKALSGVLRFVKSHWFLPFLSGNGFATWALKSSFGLYLYLEKGWIETWFWKRRVERLVLFGKVGYSASHHPKVISWVFIVMILLVVFSLF